jgi:glycosyltransferase involved in cell wall biosynthesis
LARLLDDAELRGRLGEQARRRAVSEFDYDHLAAKLYEALVQTTS